MTVLGLALAIVLLFGGLVFLLERVSAAAGEDAPAPKRAPQVAPPPVPSPVVAAPPAPKPAPGPSAHPPRTFAAVQLHSLAESGDDEDITIITLAPAGQLAELAQAARSAAKATTAPVIAPPAEVPPATVPAASFGMVDPVSGDDEYEEPKPAAIPILYDEDARVDEPTRMTPLILVSAAAQTDQGRRRRRNEDSMLVLDEHHLFVVADGMGGHAGGDVASKMAVDVIGRAFQNNDFADEHYADVPRRGAELAIAIQAANRAVYEHARTNAAYQGMGTTVVAARFSPNKQRLYLGHVGDSRCYRLRGGQLTQVTTDHTMAAEGLTGPLANHLNRAVGILPAVTVDLIIARPRPDDVYVLCSDGLSKMVPDDKIKAVLVGEPDADKAVATLVAKANAEGGRDNITVVVVQVKDATGLARYIQSKSPAPAPAT
jgi:protein phosphatase